MDFTVRPITPDEIDRIPLRCWPDRDTLAKLFMSQESIGMAAWDGNRCIAQLHCYRIDCPDGLVSNWPAWNRPWWTESVQKSEVNLQFPAWCHACFHVGRTLQTAQEEVLELVHRFAQQSEWDVDRIHEKLNLFDAVYLSRKEVENAVHELFISNAMVSPRKRQSIAVVELARRCAKNLSDGQQTTAVRLLSARESPAVSR